MKNVRIGRVLFIGCLLGLLLVISVIAVPAANAQVCPPWVDQVSCLQQDAYNIVHNARRQSRANQAIANLENMIFRGGYYGYYDGGVFNPVYDRNRQPISKREGAITGAAIGAPIGAAIGSLKNHPGTGALFGAGGGALIGFLLSGRGGDNHQVDCSKRKLNRKEQKACATIVAEQQAAIAQERAQAELAERQRTSKRFYNNTGFSVDIFDGDQFVVNLRRGQNINLPEAREGYRAEILVPDRSMPGRTVRVEADFRLAKDRSGWVFTAPDRGGV